MSDTAIGFLIIGVGMLFVLGVAFAIAARGAGPAKGRPQPPTGVHLPAPSFLPVVMSLGAALIGSGLAFRGEDQLANPFLAIPGLLVLILGVVAWVRAANHEWRDTEHGSHSDGATH
ncbi:MAG TPA: hypothetical protein VJ975_00690 [Candidatus Limnocylindria bacterium]|nr:hypothetical protein [Candidatus Limnocylindria bacterium]